MVSGARRPLALALALLGRLSVWPVLLSPWGQPSLLAVCRRLTPTCHHWEVVESGKRKAGQGGSVKPHTTSYCEAMRTPPKVSLVDFIAADNI